MSNPYSGTSVRSDKKSTNQLAPELLSPRTPTSPSYSRETTPKPSYTARNVTITTTETDTSADERIAKSVTSYKLKPSPHTNQSSKAKYRHKQALKYQPSVSSEGCPSIILSDSPEPSEGSEYETDQNDHDSVNSHMRRRKELAALVAGLGLKADITNANQSYHSVRSGENAEDGPFAPNGSVGLALTASYNDVAVDEETERDEIANEEPGKKGLGNIHIKSH